MNVLALQCSGVNNLNLVKFSKPNVADDSALLKIKYCGICGTDLHGIEGKRAINFPFIPGHEITATIDSLGKDAGKFIKVYGGEKLNIGDRVTINPRIVCGKCYYCKNFPNNQEMCLNAITATSIGSNHYPHLFGGWAEYIYISPGSEIIKIPENLKDELAVLIEPYSCAVGCVDRYSSTHNWKIGDAFSINDPIAIYGIGAIGLFMVAAFHLAGAKKIIAIDKDMERLALAKEFGASHTINILSTHTNERIEIIRKLTDNLGAGVVVEACGVPITINEGIQALRRGGYFYEIGHLLDAGMAKIDPQYVCRNEIKILGHYAYPSSLTMLQTAKLLDKHELPYEKLVKFFDLDKYADVIFNKKTNNAIKPVFKCDI